MILWFYDLGGLKKKKLKDTQKSQNMHSYWEAEEIISAHK